MSRGLFPRGQVAVRVVTERDLAERRAATIARVRALLAPPDDRQGRLW